MWRQYSTLKSNGVNSHLCGFTTSESALSAPRRIHSYPGTIAATPAYAASMCSHTRSRAQMAPISSTGSMLVLDVLPTVAITATAQPRAILDDRPREQIGTHAERHVRGDLLQR
jgi:hypothetical protein